MARILGNNPFKNPLLMGEEPEEPVLTKNDVDTIRAAISDADEFTTACFKIRKTYLKKIRDYAFTNRLEQKEALDQILEGFFASINDADLMECPEKPKKTRKRGAD